MNEGAKIKATSIADTLADFTPQLHRLGKSIGLLTVIADRIEGARPQDATVSQEAPPSHCLQETVSRQRSELQMLCSTLEDVSRRIERAMGFDDNQPSNSKLERPR